MIDHSKFLERFRASDLAQKFEQEDEAARLERRRAAVADFLVFEKTEAKYIETLRAAERDVEAAKAKYEAAEAALRAAGAALFMAVQHVESLGRDRQRDESAARGAVATERNTRAGELLFGPLQDEIYATMRATPYFETRVSQTKFYPSGEPAVESHVNSVPSILARREFLTRASGLAADYFLHTDDADAELSRVAKAILEAAPSAENLREIPLTQDGFREAKDSAIREAREKAESLAKAGFVTASAKKGLLR